MCKIEIGISNYWIEKRMGRDLNSHTVCKCLTAMFFFR